MISRSLILRMSEMRICR